VLLEACFVLLEASSNASSRRVQILTYLYFCARFCALLQGICVSICALYCLKLQVMQAVEEYKYWRICAFVLRQYLHFLY
jgi:hypothetical protein